MEKPLRKVISMLLVVCLVVQLFPAMAFAETESERHMEQLETFCLEEHGMTPKELAEKKDVLTILFHVGITSNVVILTEKMAEQCKVLDSQRIIVYAKKGEAGFYADEECSKRIDKLYIVGCDEENYREANEKAQVRSLIEWKQSGNREVVCGQDEDITEKVFHQAAVLYPTLNGYETRTYDEDGEKLYLKTTYDTKGQPVRYENADGAVSTLEYDGNGNMVKFTNAIGAVTENTYTMLGSIKSTTTPNGYTTTYDYEEYKKTVTVGKGMDAVLETVETERIKKITYPDGSTEEYEYDDFDRLKKYKYPSGAVDVYEYDGRDRLTSFKTLGPDNSTLKYYTKSYRITGETIEGRGSDDNDVNTLVMEETTIVEGERRTVIQKRFEATRNHYYQFEDGSLGYEEFTELTKNREETVIDSKGNQTITRYENDLPVEIYYPAEGQKISCDYDEFKNIVKESLYTEADEVTVVLQENSYTYHDEEGTIKTKVHTDSLGNKETYTYDKHGNLLSQRDKRNQETVYELNDAGQTTKITSPLGYETVLEYDILGQLAKVTDPEGNVVTMTYDDEGNMVSQCVSADGGEEIITYFAYDSRGRMTKATDGQGNVIEIKEYDVAGNVTRQVDGAGGEIITQYNGVGDVVIFLDGEKNRTVYTYNEYGEVKTVCDGEEGVTRYEYDVNGNVEKVTDARNHVTKYTYDSLDRVKSITAVMESGNETASCTYDKYGNIASITDGANRTVSYVYDSEGNLLTTIDGFGKKEERRYDPAGNLLSVTERNGNVTLYTYDEQNRLKTEDNNQGTVKEYSYNSVDKVTEEKITTEGQTIIKTNTYDEAGRLICASNPLAEEGSRENRIFYEYDKKGQVIKETYEDGESYTLYEYDGEGRVTSKNFVSGEEIYGYTYSYDKNDNVTSERDPLGRVKRYSYTGTGLVEKEEYEINQEIIYTKTYEYDGCGNNTKITISGTGEESIITEYAYDEKNRCISEKDGNGNEIMYSYDGADNLLSVVYPDGGEESYTYDANGQLISVTDAEGGVICYGYDVNGNRTSVTDGNGKVTEYQYDLLGRVTDVIDAEKGVHRYVYDGLSRIVKEINADGGATKYTYDKKGRILTETAVDGSTLSHTYDSLDRVMTTRDQGGNVTGFEYDALGNVIRKYVEGELSWEETYTYDKGSRCLTYTNAQGGTYEYSYDSFDRLVTEKDPKGNVKSYTYDFAGNLISQKDGNGNVTSHEYDSNGNLTKTTDALGTVSRIDYDAMNRPIMVEKQWKDELNKIDKLQKTIYRYDKMGRVVQEISSANADRAEEKNVPCKSYTYDKVGNVKTKTEEDGSTTTFEYNGLNLVRNIIYDDGEEVNFTYDKTGALVAMEDGTGSTTIEVDGFDRITAVIDPKGREVEYSYDERGNLAALVYPDETSVTYEYDGLNRLIAVTDMNGRNKKETSYCYEGSNQVIVTHANGEKTKYIYDKNGKLSQLWEYGQDGGFYEYSEYGYDENGNRTSTITYEREKEKTWVKSEENYVYDALNRLAETTINGKKTTYTYDSMGNLIAEFDEEGTTKYLYNILNQLVSKKDKDGTTTYSYDKRGNRIEERSKEGASSYKYSFDNRLVEGENTAGETVKYIYNGLGMRVERSTETIEDGKAKQEYIIDYLSGENNDLVIYSEGKEDWTKRNVYAQGQHISMNKTASGKSMTYYVHEDIMGSTIFLRTEDGKVATETSYNPWGEPVSKDSQATSIKEIAFTGHPYDDVLDMYFAQARFYDAQNKTFISTDPAKDGLNWYQYCRSNPVNYWDPSGCISKAKKMWINMENCDDEVELAMAMEQAEYLEKNPEARWALVKEDFDLIITGIELVANVGGPITSIIASAGLEALRAVVGSALDAAANKKKITAAEVLEAGAVAAISDVAMGLAVTGVIGLVGLAGLAVIASRSADEGRHLVNGTVRAREVSEETRRGGAPEAISSGSSSPRSGPAEVSDFSGSSSPRSGSEAISSASPSPLFDPEEVVYFFDRPSPRSGEVDNDILAYFRRWWASRESEPEAISSGSSSPRSTTSEDIDLFVVPSQPSGSSSLRRGPEAISSGSSSPRSTTSEVSDLFVVPSQPSGSSSPRRGPEVISSGSSSPRSTTSDVSDFFDYAILRNNIVERPSPPPPLE